MSLRVQDLMSWHPPAVSSLGTIDDGLAIMLREEAAEVLEWALGKLSPENRAVLTLVHLDGYSVREAAQLLGWSLVNVKVRAHRARQALRALLRRTLVENGHDRT